MNVRALVIALTVTPTLLAAGPAPTPPPLSDASLQGASALALPSIVLVLQNVSGALFDNRDNATHGPYDGTYAGTGFFVSADGYLVTAAHVAAPTPAMIKDELVDFDIDQAFKCDIQSAADRCQGVENQHHDEFAAATTLVNPHVDVRVLTQDMQPAADGVGATVTATIPTPDKDIAVLKIEGSNEPVALLADATKILTGSPVAVVGYPVSGQSHGPTLVPTITSGKVVDKRHGDALGEIAVNADLFQVDAHTEHGNSGGPGLEPDGAVIGIVSFGDTQHRNFLVSSADVATLMATTPARNQLGVIDTAYRQGLRAYQARDYATARRFFDQCAQLNPAQIYCRDGALNAAGGGAAPVTPAPAPSGGLPAWAERVLWALIGALLGCGLTAAIAGTRRPRVPVSAVAGFSPGYPPRPWAGVGGLGIGQLGYAMSVPGVPSMSGGGGLPAYAGAGHGWGYPGTPAMASLYPIPGHLGGGHAVEPIPAATQILGYATAPAAPPAAIDATSAIATAPPAPPPDVMGAGVTAAAAVGANPHHSPVPCRPRAPEPTAAFPEPAIRAQLVGAATMGI